MDNFLIDVTARGRESLRHALAIAFEHNAPGGKAHYWAKVPGVGLVLLWAEEDVEYSLTSKGELIPYDQLHTRREEVDPIKSGRAKPHLLMAPVTAETSVDLIWQWLQSLPEEEYFNSLNDCDVSESKGWRVFCERWGHFRNTHYSICVIQPVWAWAGK
jgi:hypothetical protein